MISLNFGFYNFEGGNFFMKTSLGNGLDIKLTKIIDLVTDKSPE